MIQLFLKTKRCLLLAFTAVDVDVFGQFGNTNFVFCEFLRKLLKFKKQLHTYSCAAGLEFSLQALKAHVYINLTPYMSGRKIGLIGL